jgi:hypothetical protein
MKSPPKGRRRATETVKLREHANKRRAALCAFLDEWEKKHGPFTAVELQRAKKELSARSMNF